MLKNLTQKIMLSAVLVLTLSGLVLAVSPLASAQNRANVCEGVNFTGAGANCGAAEPDKSTGEAGAVVKRFLQIFSIVVGIAAVVMILFSGFRYITAGGDASKINTAQQTLIYAIVGLVVAGLSQVIIRYVIGVAS